jgi:hypothetical protein
MTMLVRRILTLLLMVLGLAACVTSRTTPAYNGAAQPAELFVSKRPARPYAAKGLVETVQARGESADQVLERMRWMAARRGCDAVIFAASIVTPLAANGGDSQQAL